MTELEDLLEREEGFVPYAYQDHLGYWTIGIGTMVDKRMGGGISREAARFMLREKLHEQFNELVEALPWIRDLDCARRDVLRAMAYQMGVGGLLKFRNTLEAVRRGDYAKAARGMRGSLWAQQTPERAERMAKAMEGGKL